MKKTKTINIIIASYKYITNLKRVQVYEYDWGDNEVCWFKTYGADNHCTEGFEYLVILGTDTRYDMLNKAGEIIKKNFPFIKNYWTADFESGRTYIVFEYVEASDNEIIIGTAGLLF